MIDVRIKPDEYSAPFIPDNPSTRLIAKNFFMDEESADVVFEVKGESETNDSAKFYAHRMILKKASPQLAELSKSDKSPSLIELPNRSPKTFTALLLYIYGYKLPDFGKISHKSGGYLRLLTNMV